MALCSEPKGWLRLRCPHNTYGWVPMRCRKCRGCQEMKQWRLAKEIEWGAESSEWVAFMTLTTPHSSGEPWDWSVIMRRFQSLVKAIRATYGRIEYVAVKEEGKKSGMRHLHVLLIGCRWVDRSWLSKAWEDRMGAWSVDIRRAGKGAAGYMAKYMAKGEKLSRKMVTFSRGYPRPKWESVMEGTPVEGINERILDGMGYWPTKTGVWVEPTPDGEVPCDCFGGWMHEESPNGGGSGGSHSSSRRIRL